VLQCPVRVPTDQASPASVPDSLAPARLFPETNIKLQDTRTVPSLVVRFGAFLVLAIIP